MYVIAFVNLTTVLALSETYMLTINPKEEDDSNFLAVGSFVTKPVSKKKKNSEAHYQQI